MRKKKSEWWCDRTHNTLIARVLSVTLLERTRNVVDQLAVAAIVINPQGIVLAFNPAAATLFGYDAAEVVSRDVQMLMTDADARNHDGYLARHMSTGENRIIGKLRHITARKKNGQTVEANLSVSKSVDPVSPCARVPSIWLGALTVRAR